MHSVQTTIARVFLALVFLGLVLLRVNAIMATPDGYLHYQMTLGQFGLPGIFAPLLILIQLVGGIALLVGFKTKLFARILAGLALFLGFILSKVSFDVLFLYMGIAGGMLLLGVHSETPYSVDGLKK